MHAVFTIVSNNYLHFARTLFEGVRKQHPASHCYCVIVDRDPGPARELASEFEVIELAQLGLPDGDRFLFQYSILELNTAVKPWAAAHLFGRGHASVTYLDPDLLIWAPLREVENALAAGADIIVTPHLLAPIGDTRHPGELEIRVSGTYNFGFCSLRASDNALQFLEWWKVKLVRDCVVDTARGIFVDQSWIDLVPGLFPNVAILRHKGYNVAYWNIAQRDVHTNHEGAWMCGDDPLVFFHFSGFNPFEPEPFSKHQNRFTLSNLGPAKTLALHYAQRLIENGAKHFASQVYGYSRFKDGSPIPDVFRRAYRTNDHLRDSMGELPFERPEAVYEPVDARIDPQRRFTYAMWSVYRHRPDLQQVFRLDSDISVRDFFHWFLIEGSGYYTKQAVDMHRELASRSGLSRIAVRAGSPMLRLLRRLMRYASPQPAQVPVEETQNAALKNAGKPEPQPYYSGLFTGDANQDGIWVGSEAVFPFDPLHGDRIHLSGSYPRDIIARHTGAAAATLQFRLDNLEIHRMSLDAEGEFATTVTVPADAGQTARLLAISCDQHFVPQALGLNLDQRALSWRLKRLSIGELALVDSTRSPMLLPYDECIAPPGVNLVGYVRAESGVGEGVRNFAKAAFAAKIPYSIVDVGFQNPNLQRDDSALAGATTGPYGIDILYVNADQTRATLDTLDTLEHRTANRRTQNATIAIWHWEQPKLPLRFLDAFDGLTEVWAPSAFVQDAIARISPIPVFKVPHAISFDISPDASRRNFGLPENGFLALVMYDFHSYQYRKNPQAAIRAFRAAAAGRDNAWLVIKTINADKHPLEHARLREDVADIRNTILLDGFMLRQQVYDLEACCDCLISLHRAEGFGLGPAEMMYLGKPVIATGWSANMEFMTMMNSFPVEYELKPLVEPLGVYEAGQPWAEASVDHAAHCLRRLLNEAGLAGQIGARAAASIRSQLDPATIGRHYRERLALVARRLAL